MRCKICHRYLDSKDCKLREIAPQLEGCDGYGIYSQSLTEKAKQKEEKAIERQKKQIEENRCWVADVREGDTVMLKADPKSIFGCSNLPRYLYSGTLKVVGVHKNGKIICDWDGGKPFLIPPEALDILKRKHNET